MDKEELKDAIRETFPDSSIKNAVERLWFTIVEVGHAYVNIFKEILAKVLSEELSDELKYLISYGIPIFIIVLLWLI